MNRQELLYHFNEEHLRALNRLVFAAEALDGPAPFERPAKLAWDSHPTTEAPESLESALLLIEEWREFANKLDDCLTEVETREADDEIGGVIAKAKEARLALIALEIYNPGRGV